jgi:hypothetical protein
MTMTILARLCSIELASSEALSQLASQRCFEEVTINHARTGYADGPGQHITLRRVRVGGPHARILQAK